MGIREYFKQHPEEEDLKLQNMVIKEKPRSEELLFDVEKEIKNSDWRELKDVLDRCVERNNWKDFSYLAFDMKTIFSERLNESDFGDEMWLEIKEEVESFDSWYQVVPLDDYLRLLVNLKKTFPNKFDSFNLSEKLHSRLLNILEKENESSNDYIRALEALRILYSEELDDVCLNNLWDRINKDLEEAIIKLKEGNLAYVFKIKRTLIDLLRISSERAGEIRLDKDVWDKLLDNLHREVRFISDNYFVGEVAKLKIIAENFVIGEEKKKYYAEKSKRPERKNF